MVQQMFASDCRFSVILDDILIVLGGANFSVLIQ